MRCLRERGGIDVSDKYGVIPAHQACRELMQGIFPTIGDLGMDRPHTALLARPLRDGEFSLQAAVELWGR
jgi:hypothetical protein